MAASIWGTQMAQWLFLWHILIIVKLDVTRSKEPNKMTIRQRKVSGSIMMLKRKKEIQDQLWREDYRKQLRLSVGTMLEWDPRIGNEGGIEWALEKRSWSHCQFHSLITLEWGVTTLTAYCNQCTCYPDLNNIL